MTPVIVSRADVWLLDFNPSRGHEQGGVQPGLVVSTDAFNQSRSRMIIVLPMTSVDKRIPFHVRVSPPEGGVRQPSFIKCEDVRAVSTTRLKRQLGRVTPETMRQVADLMRALLDL
ncbi:MAG: type II toxin-antitoxin system PemK/MazF family toxin [Chloroflexia bacterium]|nr:type II toxin-antitoxin system PemK/MazF family toxin [Chloroflexia bacterium]MDQ3411397.1 type II toxin-antitoxin system PemK/MazF family toxin [Chloroflexota bacterium]